MPKFGDDDNITNDEAGIRQGSNLYLKNAVIIADGENTTLDVEFAALEAILPDYTLVEGPTEGFEDTKEANSIDLQDSTLAYLHRQTSILSSAIKHIQYLELCREDLRQEKKMLEDRLHSLREGIRNLNYLMTIEGIAVDLGGE